MKPENFLAMTKQMVNGTVGNVWQDQLNAFYGGGGAYWVPDPQFGMTESQLLAGANQCQIFIDTFENYFTYIFKSEYTNPMHTLQDLLKQKKYKYELAIAELKKQQLPPVQTRPTDEIIEVPDETTTTAGVSTTTLLLVGAGVVGLYLYTRKKRNNRQKVSGSSNLLPLGAAAIALYFIAKGQKPTDQETTAAATA